MFRRVNGRTEGAAALVILVGACSSSRETVGVFVVLRGLGE